MLARELVGAYCAILDQSGECSIQIDGAISEIGGDAAGKALIG